MNCCGIELNFKDAGGIEVKISVALCSICGTEYHNKQNSKIFYKYRPGLEDFICNSCHEEILTTRVAHTVRDGLFEFSGSGKVNYEEVPYCPKCEMKPKFHGKAVNG